MNAKQELFAKAGVFVSRGEKKWKEKQQLSKDAAAFVSRGSAFSTAGGTTDAVEPGMPHAGAPASSQAIVPAQTMPTKDSSVAPLVHVWMSNEIRIVPKYG